MYNLIEDKIAYLKQLEIKTSRLIDNLNYGQYLSIFRGTGMDFSDVREYQYGDDIRFIDWNVSARFNELYIKQFQEERDLSVVLAVDVSSSFLFGSEKAKFFSSIEFIALISFIVDKAGDNIGALFFSDKPIYFIPPKKGKKQVFKILDFMLNLNIDRSLTDLQVGFNQLLRLVKKNSVVFFISDFLSDIKDYNLLNLCAKKFDFILVRIQDPIEKELPEDIGLILVEDPESGEQFILDTTDKEFLKAYKEAYLLKDKEFKDKLSSAGLDFIDIVLGNNYVYTLIKFFNLRNRRMRR